MIRLQAPRHIFRSSASAMSPLSVLRKGVLGIPTGDVEGVLMLEYLQKRWRRIEAMPARIERAEGLLGAIDAQAAEIRQRCANIEDKISQLSPPPGEYRGSPHQRYGHISYSQHGEDMVFIALFERLGIASPSFLDIGANHPVELSNTALLRSRCGSRGVNIDASPEVIEIFKRERPDDINVNVGVAGKPGVLPFYRFDPTSGLNTFSKSGFDRLKGYDPHCGTLLAEIMVPVITLDQVIDKYCGGKCPDLLSIDAENLDYEILEAATFRSRPKVLCVETITTLNNEAAMDELIRSKGFRKCVQMFANAVYVEKDAKV
jgi:FkbM family methyltransferase